MPLTPANLPPTVVVTVAVATPGVSEGCRPTMITDSVERLNGVNMLRGSFGLLPRISRLGHVPSRQGVLVGFIGMSYMGTERSGAGTPSSRASNWNVFHGSICGTDMMAVTLVAPAGTTTSCVTAIRLRLRPQPPG